MGSLESWGLNEMNFDMQTNIDERLNTLVPMNDEPIVNNESLGSIERWRLNGDNGDIKSHKSTTVVELSTPTTGKNRGRRRRKNIDDWARNIAKRK